MPAAGPLSRLQRHQLANRELAAVFPGIYRAATHGQLSPRTIGARVGAVKATEYSGYGSTGPPAFVPIGLLVGAAFGIQAAVSARHKQARYRRALRREVRGAVVEAIAADEEFFKQERYALGRAVLPEVRGVEAR